MNKPNYEWAHEVTALLHTLTSVLISLREEADQTLACPRLNDNHPKLAHVHMNTLMALDSVVNDIYARTARTWKVASAEDLGLQTDNWGQRSGDASFEEGMQAMRDAVEFAGRFL